MGIHSEHGAERTDEQVQVGRRSFLRTLRRWSAAVLAGVVTGAGASVTQAGWVNRRGGGGWLNGGGGGGWLNAGGGGGWANRRGGGGWLNAR